MSEDQEPQVEFRGTGFYMNLVIIGLLVVALLALALQNTESVGFEFLWWDLDVPLFGLVIAAALVAVVIDELTGLVWRRRRRRHLTERQELERLRRQADQRPATPAASDSAEGVPPIVVAEPDERPQDD